jgi:heptosyltransferase-1
MAERRFLVVRLGSLGDIVHTFPAVAGLRESFPKAEIVWVTHPRWSELISRSGLATGMVLVDVRKLSSLQDAIGRVGRAKWDAAIDYQGLWKSALLPFLGGVSRRIGFSGETIREFGVPILYTERVKGTAAHIAEQNGELTLRAGAAKAVARFELKVLPEEERLVLGEMRSRGLSEYIVLSPGGGWRSKCWPAERFGALCEKIFREMGMRCVINFGPGEEELAGTVRAASGDAAPVLYDGALGQLMALVRNAKCIVGGDTGPLHLAVALKTPAVAIFGPTNPERNGPYPAGDIVLRSTDAAGNHKRGTATDESLLKISVEQVFAAVGRRMRKAI